MTRPRYVGGPLTLCQGYAVGTLYCRDVPPDSGVVVELLVDDYPVALGRAEPAPVAPENMKDGLTPCAFEIELPVAARTGARRIAVRVANTGEPVGVAAITHGVADEGAGAVLVGAVQRMGPLLLGGWVAKADYDDEPIAVHAVHAGERIASALADLPAGPRGPCTAPLLAAGFRLRLPHGFGVPVPQRVDVCDEDGRPLHGSPFLISPWTVECADMLHAVVQSETPPGAEHKRALLRIQRAMDAGAMLVPSSVPMSDYPRWASARSARAEKDTPPVHVFIFGDGDGDGDRARSLHSLIRAGAPLTATVLPDAKITPTLWPEAGMVVFLPAGEEVKDGAFAHLSHALEHAPIAYGDCEQQLYPDAPVWPWFKPDWDPDLFLSTGFLFGLLGLRAERITRPEKAMPVAALIAEAVLAATAPKAPAHVPFVLSRQVDMPAHGAPPLPAALVRDGLRHALSAHTPDADIAPEPDRPWQNRVRYGRLAPTPHVEIIVPTRDRPDLLARALESLFATTRYPDYGVTIIDNGSTETETFVVFDRFVERGARVLAMPGPFNFSALNNAAVVETDAPVLCFLNNDVEIIEPGWLGELVVQLSRPGIGAVGAKLLWPNGMVQHAGVVLGPHGGAAHIGKGWAVDDPGYAGLNHVVRRCSAVTAACMAVRRADFLDVGGFDEAAFPVNFNDVDLCLKLQRAGKAVLWTPHARLIHHEAASRGADDGPQKAARARRELRLLRERWPEAIRRDPFYNPNFNRDLEPYDGMALMPLLPPDDPV